MVVGCIWMGLGAAFFLLEAAPWLLALVAIATLPATWEFLTNPASGLDLSDRELTWFSGRRHVTLARGEIERIRFDTRLDLSVRATAVLTTGKKVRLPYECTPPSQLFEAELTARGIRTERHHFSPLG